MFWYSTRTTHLNYLQNDFPTKNIFSSHESANFIKIQGQCSTIWLWHIVQTLTMTHRADSDIPAPYFSIEKKGDKRKQMLRDNFNFAAGKSKKIAWVVSRCQTRSEREIYVKELRKYIEIDIYGKCGNFTCFPCWSRLNATYKFYLAFENNFCIDYYTEKVGRTLSLGGMIPVVMGGANYSKFLPPYSYIDAMDFASPRALAEYLHELDNNDTLYNEYFKWLWHYNVFNPNLHCALCAYLHTNRDEIKVYDNIKTWYDPATRCRLGNWSHYDWG